MTIKQITELSTEQLIANLCHLYIKETKTAHKELCLVTKELEKRGIISAEKFLSMLR